MKKLPIQLLITFTFCLFLYLLFTFTALNEIQFPFFWEGSMVDGRYYVITLFALIVFSLTLINNIKSKFRNVHSLYWLIGGTVILLLWMICYYIFRLLMIMVFLALFGSDKTIWDFTVIDLLYYLPLLLPLGMIVFSIVRIRRIKRGKL